MVGSQLGRFLFRQSKNTEDKILEDEPGVEAMNTMVNDMSLTHGDHHAFLEYEEWEVLEKRMPVASREEVMSRDSALKMELKEAPDTIAEDRSGLDILCNSVELFADSAIEKDSVVDGTREANRKGVVSVKKIASQFDHLTVTEGDAHQIEANHCEGKGFGMKSSADANVTEKHESCFGCNPKCKYLRSSSDDGLQLDVGCNAKWENRVHIVFIRLCENEIKKGNTRLGTPLSKSGWKNVVAELNGMRTGHSYNARQVQNHWDITKNEYKLWKQLKTEASGIGWDYLNNNFAANDAWWERKIEENGEYAKFRNRDLGLFKDKYPALFDNNGSSPKRKLTEDQGSASKKAKKLTDSSLKAQIDLLLDVISKSKAESPHSQEQKVATIAQCMRIMRTMKGIKHGTPFWNFACNLFMKEEAREVFVAQQDEGGRLSWLEYNYNLTLLLESKIV